MLSQLFIRKSLQVSQETPNPLHHFYMAKVISAWIPHFDSCQLTTTWMCNIRMQAITIYLFIYQLFWTQACPEGMCTNGTQVPCEVPSLPNPTTRKGWPHHRGIRPLLFSNSDVGSFMSHKNKSVKLL